MHTDDEAEPEFIGAETCCWGEDHRNRVCDCYRPDPDDDRLSSPGRQRSSRVKTYSVSTWDDDCWQIVAGGLSLFGIRPVLRACEADGWDRDASILVCCEQEFEPT